MIAYYSISKKTFPRELILTRLCHAVIAWVKNQNEITPFNFAAWSHDPLVGGIIHWNLKRVYASLTTPQKYIRLKSINTVAKPWSSMYWVMSFNVIESPMKEEKKIQNEAKITTIIKKNQQLTRDKKRKCEINSMN